MEVVLEQGFGNERHPPGRQGKGYVKVQWSKVMQTLKSRKTREHVLVGTSRGDGGGGRTAQTLYATQGQ